MSRKHQFFTAAALSSFCIVAFALKYTFVTAIDFSSDQAAEYPQTLALFKTLQGAGARFSPDDTLTFTYNDGTVATFGLEKGTAGMCFPTGKCIWSTTEPFTNGGRPTEIRNRPGRVRIPTPPSDVENAPRVAVDNSGWYDFTPVKTPLAIAFPNAQPIGQLWGDGVVTVGPLITRQVNGTPLTPGATITVTSSLGQTVTATVSQDGQSIKVETGGGGRPTIPVDVEAKRIFAFRDSPLPTFRSSAASMSFSVAANNRQTKSIVIYNQDTLSVAVVATVGVRSGSGLGNFTAVVSSCGNSLSPGASCAVNVTYQAGCGSAGSNAAKLYVGETVVPISGGYSSGTCY